MKDITEEKLNLSKNFGCDDFIAALAHDLKNPLLAQLRTLEMISENKFGSIDKTVKDMIDLTIESSLYMKKLLFSTLDAYKKDKTTLSLNKEYFDIEKMVSNCIDEVSVLLKEKNLQILLNKNINEPILADISQLRRVVANLISNAINYSFSNTKIMIRLDKIQNNFIFEIENLAETIPESAKNQIFEKDFGDNFGLGLFISKRIIEAHKGEIELITKGNRNIFRFNIPL